MKFVNNTMIAGEWDNIDDELIQNIHLGIYNSEARPFFIYDGNIIKQFETSAEEQKCELREVIEEVFDIDWDEDAPNIVQSIKETDVESASYIITRDIKKDSNYTKVSLIYINNNKLYIWIPTFRELLQAIKNSGELNVVRVISDKIHKGINFKVSDFYNPLQSEIAPGYYSITSINENLRFPTLIIHSLIKHIMVSEELRYEGGAGKYYIMMALYDYIINKESLSDVLVKYKIE